MIGTPLRALAVWRRRIVASNAPCERASIGGMSRIIDRTHLCRGEGPVKAMLRLLTTCLLLACCVSLAAGQATYSWRYYRPGNTGIQGDDNQALWIGPDGDPYIGGYDGAFEEGGFAKFIQSENRWVNYSNVDYPVIGHPDEQGCVRVTDIVPDVTGKLWMGTWRGALTFDPAVGPGSLTRYGPGNTPLSGETVFDVERAPDGTMWFADNGCVRHDPATNTWTQWATGNRFLAAQPKVGGGYYVWSADDYHGYVFRFDSATQAWTTLPYPPAPGDIAGMPGKDCVDDAGNFWALRLVPDGGWETLDYRRSDGTWVTPAPPYPSVTFDIWAFRAFGNAQALLANGNGDIWRFNGSSWQNLGQWRPGLYTEDVDIDGAGNVWACGLGGAAKRDAETGAWQRYRITNTSNFDQFNRDLTIAANGDIYTGANAGAGIGGMVRFDGVRWTGWNQLTYGLGYDWPFLNDYCTALAYRPSTGRVVVSPLNWLYGIHEWTGSGFQQLPGLDGAVRMCEDSQARLWALGEYFNLNYYGEVGWTSVPIAGWGAKIQPDPTRPGTVWATTGYELLRTDGAYRFSRTIDDFPELESISDQFSGLAVAPNGIAWVGSWTPNGATGGGELIRVDANTGTYQMLRYDDGWPLPGQYVQPLAVTPDGRLWMQYDSDYLVAQRGLCWYDGTNVGVFPAPPGGEPQWGGLPHAAIDDLEVREIANGYELWMSCVSRGLAVLTVEYPDPTGVAAGGPAPGLLLQPCAPNPFRSATTLSFSLPGNDRVRIGIYDVQGRQIRQLADERLAGGRNTVAWDGKDEAGRSVVSGVYFWKLKASSGEATQRMVLLR